MIEGFLNKMSLTEYECQELRRRIPNTNSLVRELSRRRSLQEVLMLIYAELTGDARPSFLERMYGRYRVLLPSRDMEALTVWRSRNGQGRKKG